MDKKIIVGIISFIGGAALGGVVAWKVTDKVCEEKYKKISDNEIKSVKDTFNSPKVEELIKTKIENNPEGKKSEKVLKTVKDKPSLTDYARKLKDGGYVNYSNTPDVPFDKDEPKVNGPFIISPDDFGDNEEYDRVSLTLYADGILADEDDTIIDAEEVVGDALEHMGEYEDDAVHVCNPEREVYYEILADNRSYKDATKKSPHRNGEEDK